MKQKRDKHKPLSNNLDMNQIVVVYCKPMSKKLCARPVEEYELHKAEILGEGYMEFARMTLREYVDL